ncbi:MAG: BON domain-containing protein [Acidobacteria bacterium]|nr:BON domain-containing protein [Acidobacteriota bacterium]MCA1610633.1 BON domain-containing protein [Acidobacteriota bacterium]
MARRLSSWIGAVALAAFGVACAQSDAGITTEVKAKIEADRTVSSSSTIQVETKQNVVTLTGKAASDAEKKRAVFLAKSAQGVKGVVDNLAIDPSVAPPDTSAAPSGAPPAAGSNPDGTSPSSAPAPAPSR